MGASVGATLDVLSVASRSAKALGRAPIPWCVVGAGSQVDLSNGLRLDVQPAKLADIPADAILVVPGLGLDHADLQGADGGSIEDRYDEPQILQRMQMPDAKGFAALLAAHRARGGRIAASCSGVLLLALSGCLDGCKATTHWRLGRFFERHFPAVRLDTRRMIVDDQGVISAGAAMAQMDLMLYLLRHEVGKDVAELTMKYLLIDTRASQARYQVWSHLQPAQDDTAQRFEAVIESSLPRVPGVGEVARQLNLTEKTLARRVFKATGSTPMMLIHQVRMRHAQRLIALGDLPLQEVAQRLGYVDAASLRKLMARMARPRPEVRPHALAQTAAPQKWREADAAMNAGMAGGLSHLI